MTSREGVMDMADGHNVPRVACQGACEKAALVVDEAGDNHFYDVLWEFGNWGRKFGRCLRVASVEQPFDFGYGSVPKPVDK